VIGWILRLILIPTGAIAGWFVAKDSPNFSAVQLVVGMVLVFFTVLVVILTARIETMRNSGD